MTEASGPLTGWKLGGWVLGCLLGAGGMGSVYRASRGEEIAAVKVLHAQWAWDAELKARFKREIEIVRHMRSGRIARLIDAETDGPVPWFATELIEGPTLEQHVVASGPLAGPRLVEFAAGLARCVDDLSQAGVVHRDIKPSNILLTDWAPILLDFGIAMARGLDHLTAPGAAVGTPAWMPPEQLTGSVVGPPADVFAWAASTAYAATGRRPFGQGDFGAVAARVVRLEPDLEGIDPQLRELLRAAFAKDPDARPQVLDVLHAVSKIELPEEVAPAADPWPLPEQKPVLAPGDGLDVGLGAPVGATGYVIAPRSEQRSYRRFGAIVAGLVPSAPVLWAALVVLGLVAVGTIMTL